jgi:methionyl-tRNA formyltransferase
MKKNYIISAAYTQPPKKSQRGQKINKSPIQSVAEDCNIDCRTPDTLKANKEEYEYLKQLDLDLVIVVAYGQIIPKEYLNLAKKRFYKHSRLPSAKVERCCTHSKIYYEFRERNGN